MYDESVVRHFILRGHMITLSRDQITTAMTGLAAQPMVKYGVQLKDHWYPPKQVVAVATGLPVAAFTTQDAYRILHRLGFQVMVKRSERTVAPE